MKFNLNVNYNGVKQKRQPNGENTRSFAQQYKNKLRAQPAWKPSLEQLNNAPTATSFAPVASIACDVTRVHNAEVK